MQNVARAALLLLAALIVAACSAGSPSTSPSTYLGGPSFTSTMYGYALTLPAGWTTTQASARWDGTGMPGHLAAEDDLFDSPTGQIAWGQAAPTNKNLVGYVSDRITANFADHGDTCPATPAEQQPIEIGGQAGTLVAWDCGLLINLAVTVHQGIGYQFAFRDANVHAATDAADQAVLAAVLGSVRLP